MPGNKCFLCKIVTFSVSGVLCLILFVASLFTDYQWLLAQEHIRFRSGFPSQANWITSPYGTLNCYLFNVTNAEAFLNGTDARLKVEEVGPIVYRIKGKNEVLNQTDSTITYSKLRYHEITFDPEASISPDILNRTIIMPNLVLLGAAAKLHDWVFMVRHAFNALTFNEPVFLNRSVYYFLWEFTTPALNVLSSYMSDIVANCGMLYNALRHREEIYNVQIGVKHGVENFFRVNTLNKKTQFPQHTRARSVLADDPDSEVYCPIKVADSFDNSLFAPFARREKDIKLVAGEACRVHTLTYNNTVEHLGFSGYRYVLGDSDKPSCLDNAMGIKLHEGMFDVSACLFNNIPSAFSAPHFYKSSYNWSEHYEGLRPNLEAHETSIIIEPISGIPIEEKYRFQSNIPMPDMNGYNKDLQRFSNIVIPSFWYEYDLDDLPTIVTLLLHFNVTVLPILQPILMIIFLLTAAWCFYFCFTAMKARRPKHI